MTGDIVRSQTWTFPTSVFSYDDIGLDAGSTYAYSVIPVFRSEAALTLWRSSDGATIKTTAAVPNPLPRPPTVSITDTGALSVTWVGGPDGLPAPDDGGASILRYIVSFKRDVSGGPVVETQYNVKSTVGTSIVFGALGRISVSSNGRNLQSMEVVDLANVSGVSPTPTAADVSSSVSLIKGSHLLPGQSYSTAVAVANTVGTSTFSLQSSLVKLPFEAPSVISSVRVTAISSSEIQVEWALPVSDGGAKLVTWTISATNATTNIVRSIVINIRHYNYQPAIQIVFKSIISSP